MAQIDIRQVAGEEMLAAMYPLTNYAFRSSPPLPDREEWFGLVRSREGVTCFAAFDGDAPMACAESTAMTQNVRGVLLGMGGIWGVATHPVARRRGLCRQLLSRLLGTMRESGEVVSGLYPFRESFYERLGWVTFPQLRKATFSPTALASLLRQEIDGEVEIMLIGDGLDIYREVTGRLQRSTHGMARIIASTMPPSRRDTSWLAVARVQGTPAGVLVYDLKGEHVADFSMRVSRFYVTSSQARYVLLQWIARHIDQATSVELMLAPTERPETWLSDLKPHVETTHVAPMARVVDVAGLQGLRIGPGSFTLRVSDPLCPWNEGVWRFESVFGALRVGPADAGDVVDAELSIQALTALVYGTHDPEDFPFRGWASAPAPFLASMGAMFPRLVPHMHEMF
jgi:predicted acetyltransferase